MFVGVGDGGELDEDDEIEPNQSNKMHRHKNTSMYSKKCAGNRT